MKSDEFLSEDQRLDAKCWKGYKKQGTKMKGDTNVLKLAKNLMPSMTTKQVWQKAIYTH